MGPSTRERILEVAERYLGELGYHGTRLHQIAQQVGIQKASLFHYFPSKEQLYLAVVTEGFGETEQTLKRALEAEAAPLQKVQMLLEEYVDMVAAHPERTKILLRQSLGDAPTAYQPVPESQRLLGMVARFVAEGQRLKEFAPIDAVALVLGVVGMVAFFFASAPVLAPEEFGDPTSPAAVERIKRHVVQMVRRCLTVDHPELAATKVATA